MACKLSYNDEVFESYGNTRQAELIVNGTYKVKPYFPFPCRLECNFDFYLASCAIS